MAERIKVGRPRISWSRVRKWVYLGVAVLIVLLFVLPLLLTILTGLRV